MILISLTSGKYAIISSSDYEKIKHIKWHYSSCGYAMGRNLNKEKVYMHRLLIGAKKGEYVDHIDGNKLNNRKDNLRICTQSENMRNSTKRANCSSIYKGVCNSKTRGWISYITLNKKRKTLGYHKSEVEAAENYNENAVKMHGKFCKLNIIIYE